MLLDGAFTVLLLICGASAVIVLPPTNVSVKCQDLKVTVSWEYSEQQPNTRFRVKIEGATGNSVGETTNHQYDLTRFIWSSEDHYMDNFWVTVTAIRGGNQSEPARSETFSFNYLKPTVRSCELDFPPVVLNAKEATVTFRNPFHHYSDLKQAKKPDTAIFQFRVSSNYTGTRCDFTVEKEDCRCKISLPEGRNQCVTLTGTLYDSIGVGQVKFRQTDRICDSNVTGGQNITKTPIYATAETLSNQHLSDSDVYVITLVVLLSIIFLIITIITIIICKVKAWTMETPSLPKFLWPDFKKQDLKYDMVSKTDISTVGVTVSNKPLVSSEEENNPTTNLQHSGTGSDFQPPSSWEAVGLTPEGHKTDEYSANDLECISIDLKEEEEEERSPYDCPHALQMDMGDGDMVTVYTGR